MKESHPHVSHSTRWTTRELLITAMIGLVLGLATGITTIATTLTIGMLGSIPSWIPAGLSLLPFYFGSYAMRKPGAALLVGFVNGLVLMPLSSFALLTLLSTLASALICEIAVWIFTRYSRFTLMTLAMVGLLTGILQYAFVTVTYRSLNIEPLLLLIELLVCIGSCIVFAWMTKFLADAVAKTGVLPQIATSHKEV